MTAAKTWSCDTFYLIRYQSQEEGYSRPEQLLRVRQRSASQIQPGGPTAHIW